MDELKFASGQSGKRRPFRKITPITGKRKLGQQDELLLPQKLSKTIPFDNVDSVNPPKVDKILDSIVSKMEKQDFTSILNEVKNLNSISPSLGSEVQQIVRNLHQNHKGSVADGLKHRGFFKAMILDAALMRTGKSQESYYTDRLLWEIGDLSQEQAKILDNMSNKFAAALPDEGARFTFLDPNTGKVIARGAKDFNSPEKPEPPLGNNHPSIVINEDETQATTEIKGVDPGLKKRSEENLGPGNLSVPSGDPPNVDPLATSRSPEQAEDAPVPPIDEALNPASERKKERLEEEKENEFEAGSEENLKENVGDAFPSGDVKNDEVDADGDTVIPDAPPENTPSEEAINAEQKSEENAEEIKKEKEKNEKQDEKMTDFQDKLFDAEQELKNSKITIDQFKEKLRDLELKFRDDKHAQQIADLQRQIKDAGENARLQFESKRELDRFTLEQQRLDLEAKRLELREKREQEKEDQREQRRREEREIEREERREEREERRKREDVIDKREARREDRELRKDEQAQKIQLAKLQPKEKNATFGLTPEQIKLIKQKSMTEIMREFREKKKKKMQKKGPKDKRKKTVNKKK